MNKKEKIEVLREKESQLKNQIKMLEQEVKSRERKLETRRKIFIGGCFIKAIREGVITEEYIKKILDKYLSAKRDRELFNLAIYQKD